MFYNLYNKNMLSKQQFRIVITQDEDGYFIASVPNLPGCHTQAKNLPTLKSRVREAISLCLDVAKRDEGYRKQIKSSSLNSSFMALDTVEV